jgi:hypothetical protein
MGCLWFIIVSEWNDISDLEVFFCQLGKQFQIQMYKIAQVQRMYCNQEMELFFWAGGLRTEVLILHPAHPEVYSLQKRFIGVSAFDRHWNTNFIIQGWEYERMKFHRRYRI